MHESWFYYRLPGSDTVWGCREAMCMIGLTPGGFAVYPFIHPGRHSPMTLVPAPGQSVTPHTILPSDLMPMWDRLPDSRTTDRNGYLRGVADTILDLDGRGKTVIARMIRVEGALDIPSTFRALCNAYPAAFVFTFSSLWCGTWIGASPELLLQLEGDTLHTMSLAGTRPTGTPGPWDTKNVEEQDLVTCFITSTLAAHDLRVEQSAPETRVAGPVEHICTPIQAHGAATLAGRAGEALALLLKDLSPTPAVCGSDRWESLVQINRVEDFDRSYYGGFIGPYLLSPENGEPVTRLYVNLRSAQVDTQGVNLYSGSGITPLSKPEDEWEETRRKAETLISRLKFIEKR